MNARGDRRQPPFDAPWRFGRIAEGVFLPQPAGMIRPDAVDDIAVVSSICRKLGLGEVAPVLLKAAHHTSVLIPSLGMVARVQSAEPMDMAWRSAVKEVAVAHHLAERDAPAIRPLATLSGPHAATSSVVTLWPYVECGRTANEGDAAIATATLATVHRSLADYAGKLPPYTQALDRCWAVLADGDACTTLSRDDRNLLKIEYQRLRRDVDRTHLDHVPLHGDAHLGNLLIGKQRAVWMDFEDACLGPREYDIASLPCEAWPYFAAADRPSIEAYHDLKSVCVAVWCSVDPSRSAEIREAADYHLQRVRAFAR